MMQRFIDGLRKHPRLGKQLFWLEGVSDEMLGDLYARSSCLLAASEGEGFGLPLIEAAQAKLPIIARDIPVFREVAGDHAFYFAGMAPDALAQAIVKWVELRRQNRHPWSEGIQWVTWAQSAERLKAIIFCGEWYKVWRPEGGRRADAAPLQPEDGPGAAKRAIRRLIGAP
jgi:glycosyltransferase involved in cell wall biosynthesis